MATITRFEEIEAWQTARLLTRDVYAVSNSGAFAKDFGLRDQMRRATVSVLSNIAEGYESRTQALFINLGLTHLPRIARISRRLPDQNSSNSYNSWLVSDVLRKS